MNVERFFELSFHNRHTLSWWHVTIRSRASDQVFSLFLQRQHKWHERWISTYSKLGTIWFITVPEAIPMMFSYISKKCSCFNLLRHKVTRVVCCPEVLLWYFRLLFSFSRKKLWVFQIDLFSLTDRNLSKIWRLIQLRLVHLKLYLAMAYIPCNENTFHTHKTH